MNAVQYCVLDTDVLQSVTLALAMREMSSVSQQETQNQASD